MDTFTINEVEYLCEVASYSKSKWIDLWDRDTTVENMLIYYINVYNFADKLSMSDTFLDNLNTLWVDDLQKIYDNSIFD